MKPTPGPGVVKAEVPIPRIGPREVLIKVLTTAICGTDVHIYNWDEWSAGRIKPPRIPGHEFYGEVVETGKDVTMAKVGEMVSVEGHFTCGQCYFCRTGQGHICQNVQIVGIDRDGSFAEYVAVPEENLWKWDFDVDPEVAAIQDPFGNAVHTALATDLVGKNVVIVGAGPIGLCAVPIARKAGAARIYVTDVNDYRLGLAKTLGADMTINAKREDPVQVVLDDTRGFGVDVMLEMSGHEEAIRQGFKMLRKGGFASLLGIPSKPVEIDLADAIIFKGATVQGINGRRMYDTWYKAMALLRSGLDITPVITHRFSLDDFETGMGFMKSGNAGKVILYPQGVPVASRHAPQGARIERDRQTDR